VFCGLEFLTLSLKIAYNTAMRLATKIWIDGNGLWSQLIQKERRLQGGTELKGEKSLYSVAKMDIPPSLHQVSRPV